MTQKQDLVHINFESCNIIYIIIFVENLQIYSLTGRDIPKTVREKLRKQPLSVLPGSQSQPNWEAPSRNEPKKRAALSSLFDDSDLRVQPTADDLTGAQNRVTSPTSPLSPTSPTHSILKSQLSMLI